MVRSRAQRGVSNHEGRYASGQASASSFETREVYHRAALRADPLALLRMRNKGRQALP